MLFFFKKGVATQHSKYMDDALTMIKKYEEETKTENDEELDIESLSQWYIALSNHQKTMQTSMLKLINKCGLMDNQLDNMILSIDIDDNHQRKDNSIPKECDEEWANETVSVVQTTLLKNFALRNLIVMQQKDKLVVHGYMRAEVDLPLLSDLVLCFYCTYFEVGRSYT